MDSSEGDAFNEAEVEERVQSILFTHLKDTLWSEHGLPESTVNYILEDIVQSLSELQRPFKYIGN